MRAFHLFCGLIAASLIVAPARLSAQIAPQAAPLVRLLESKYRDAGTLQAAFLQTYRDGRSGIQVESGTVYFGGSGRMRWEYESPETKLFVSDGKTVWFFVPDDRTVTRSPIKESDDWRTPLALLAGKAKLAQLCGQIGISGAPGVAPGHTVLNCIPRGTKVPKTDDATESSQQGILTPAPYDRVLLEIDSASGELADVRILQQGGVELEFRFGQWQRDLPLEQAMFRFQPPAGVTVLDESAR